MNYQEAVDYILRFADYERLPRSGVVWDLARIERLLARLGNPHDAARSVHIAGTKGKGSTAAMVASMLHRAGYKVGLYTSPHLLSFTERIRLNGSPIAEADWARLTETLKPEIEAVNAAGDLGELTTFEILTALAFTCFREAGVDYQVLEVGLGGRLDATNVIRPEVCVITSISYDHTEVLGNTLAEIAGEKAGIIKPGATVVCSPQFPEAMVVIERVCRDKGVRLVKVGADINWRMGEFDMGGQMFHLRGLARDYDLKIPLLGEYQVENAAAAVAAVEILTEGGAKVTAGSVATGLEQLNWPGRLQILRREPWVIVDGAHNAYSLERLGEALRQYFVFKRLILVIGVSSDKDVGSIVAEAASLTGEVIVARSRNPRAVMPAALAEAFSKRGIVPRTAESVAAAMELALEAAQPCDLVCATGSVFVVAEALEYVAALS